MFKKALTIVITLMLALSLNPVAMAAGGSSNITMTVAVGYGGKYVVGELAPVLVTIKNNGSSEIDGTIELRTGIDFDVMVQRDVVLPQNTEKQFVLFVMASSIYTPKDFEVTLKNGNSVVATATPQTVTGIDPSNGLCGILSDDTTSVAYMKKILFTQSVQKDWIKLSKDNLYDNSDLLKSFDVLVISHFDASQLTESQRNAVSQWVYRGGTLVLGTGPGQEAAVSQWKDLLNGLSIGGSATATNLSEISALGQGKALNGTLPILDIKNSGWSTDAQDGNGKALVLHKPVGGGTVFVTPYDLGSGTMGSWEGNSLQWQTLFDRSVSGSSNINRQYMYSNGASGILTALQAGQAGGFTFWLFMMVLVLFIALAGFVCYFILKKLNRQKLMWVMIPVLSVLFSGFLLLSGRFSFGRKPYMYAFASTNISSSVAVSEHTLAFIAPAMGDYKLAVEEPGLLFPVEDNTSNYYNQPSQTVTPAKRTVTVVANAASPGLKFLNVNLNGTRQAQFNTYYKQAPLELSFEYDGKSVTCKLKNTTQSTIKDTTVVIGNNDTVIGDLGPGKETEITMPLDQTPLDQTLWSVIDTLYPSPGGMLPIYSNTDREKATKGAFMHDQVSVLQNTNNPGLALPGALGQAYCFGWVEKPFEYNVTINGQNIKPQTLELITALTPIRQKNDGNSKLEVVTAYAQLNTSLTPTNSGQMKGNMMVLESGKAVVLDFSLANISALKLDKLFFDAGLQQGTSGGTWTIYNWNTGAWDNAASKYSFEQGVLERYINAQGMVRISATASAQDYLQGMPFVWVQGVRK